MKNSIILFTILLFFKIVANAQPVDYTQQEQRISALEKQNIALQQQNDELKTEVVRIDQRCLVLSLKADSNKRMIKQLLDSLKVKMQETNATIEENAAEVNKGVKNRSLWGIIIAMLLAVLTAALFLLLRRLIAKKGDDIELLRARADDLNRQMVEKMDKELAELQNIATAANTSVAATSNNDAEPDHSLVKALAYGITRIEYNLQAMSPEVKGYKQLQIALRKMKDNLRANNYEIVDMLGQEYNEGMTLSNITFKKDPNMEDGKLTITRVIQPQINYRNKAIQFADIEVSRNI